MQVLPSIPLIVPGAPQSAPADRASDRSAAGPAFLGISNPPRAAAFFSGIAERIGSGLDLLRSGLHRVHEALDGIRNLFRSAPATPARTFDMNALLVEGCACALAEAAPTLLSTQVPGAHAPDPAQYDEALSALRSASASLQMLARRLGPDTVPAAVRQQLDALAGPDDPALQLRETRDAAVAIAACMGRRDLVAQVAALPIGGGDGAVGNAAVAPQTAAAAATSAAPVDMSALMLGASESTMLNRLPQLAAMLQPDAAALDLAAFGTAFRTLGAGTNGFVKLLATRPDIVPADIADRAKALADPKLVIAGGETKTDVWHRIETGTPADVAFLEGARGELLAHVEDTQALALAFMAGAGNHEFAGKLDAAFAEHARKASA